MDSALTRHILVVNAGSSSLKLSLLDGNDVVVASRDLDTPRDAAEALGAFVSDAPADIAAVGHRVVHGGTDFTSAVVIDPAVERALSELTQLAPLHQPAALAAIHDARRAIPGVPHVACFDTAFHASLPPAAATYALPAEWRAQWPLRRFGFHGLSHAYASRRACDLAGAPVEQARVVSCHLGGGASLCAVEGGRSVDTTMGFTPLQGLVMATRAGSIDPGIVTWLQQRGGVTVDEVQEALERKSGLVGLCGTSDMREVISRRSAGDADATLAFDVYCHSLRRALGAMTAVLGGADIVVFTGGVGEHAAEVRATCGLALDPSTNASASTDTEISAPGAASRTFVVTAREDLEIASQVRALLDA
ncbi:MAG TPA: acetate/propionate family kinase [Acidimicrobiia bacterium]